MDSGGLWHLTKGRSGEKFRIRKFKGGGKKQHIHTRGIMISRFYNVSVFIIYLFIFSCAGSLLLGKAFCSFGEGGLLSAVVQRLLIAASPAVGYSPWHAVVFSGCHTGLVALRHVRSSWTGDWTRVPCTGRQFLIHCVTREVLFIYSFSVSLFWHVIKYLTPILQLRMNYFLLLAVICLLEWFKLIYMPFIFWYHIQRSAFICAVSVWDLILGVGTVFL